MIIDPIGQSAYSTTTIPASTVPEENESAQETVVITTPDTSAEEQDGIIAATDEQTDDGDGKTKGVLRLLQAGHFRGVADVRLRINFHDEIAAMEHEQFAQTAQQGLSDLQDVVDSEAASLVDNPDLESATASGVADALAAFDTAMAQRASDMPADAAALTDQIRADFDNLMSSLKTALGIDAESDANTPTEDLAVTEDIPESTPQTVAVATDETSDAPVAETAPAIDFQTFIDNLIGAFETKLQEFQTSLTDIRVLPELSEPHGNGKAYDKFVSIYNDMRTPSTSATPESVIDTNA